VSLGLQKAWRQKKSRYEKKIDLPPAIRAQKKFIPTGVGKRRVNYGSRRGRTNEDAGSLCMYAYGCWRSVYCRHSPTAAASNARQYHIATDGASARGLGVRYQTLECRTAHGMAALLPSSPVLLPRVESTSSIHRRTGASSRRAADAHDCVTLCLLYVALGGLVT